MAEESPNAEILNMLLGIKGQIDELSKENQEMKEKIKNVEVLTNAPPQIDLASNAQNDNNEMADEMADMGFEPSDSDLSEKEENDENLTFKSRVKSDILGPDIDEELSCKFNEGLLKQSNITEIQKIIEANPFPGNITALRTPDMNPEIKYVANSNIGYIEQEMTFIQKDVGTAIGMCANIINDMRKKSFKFDRSEIFMKLNDITSMLTASHKSATYVRKLNVKALLKEDLQPLCAKKGTKERQNNSFVFGDELGKQAEEAKKFRNVVMKDSNFKANYKSKNGFRASRKGHLNQKREKYQTYFKKSYHQGKRDKEKPKRQ